MTASDVDELLAWASTEFRQSWERLCRVAHRLSLGAELTPDEARVRVLFTPLEVDYAAVYPLLGAVIRTILFQPARLGTVVHSPTVPDPAARSAPGRSAAGGPSGRGAGTVGKATGRVIRAYHEDTREGHYVKLTPLELPELVPLDGERLLRLANERAEAQGLPRLDWVKVADLRFFRLFKDAGYDARKLFVAARTAIENGWIAFHPVPPAFQALFRWMRRMKGVDPTHLRTPEFPIPDTAVAVRGPSFTTVLHSTKLAVRFPDDGPFEGLAERVVERGVAPRCLAVRAEPLLRFLRGWLHRDQWDWYYASEHLAGIGAFAKRLGDGWDVAPRPTGLSRLTLWLSRWIFLPMDTDFLLRRGVATVLRQVVAPAGPSRFGLVVEDRGRALAAVELRLRDGAVEEILTHPPERFDNSIEPAAAFGYNPAFPVVVVHLGTAREWLRFGEASWGERMRIASRLPFTLLPERLARSIPRRRRWWLWQMLRLPFLRR